MRGVRNAARRSSLAAIFAVGIAMCVQTASAGQSNRQFTIDSMSLRQALNAWAIQSGQMVLTFPGGADVPTQGLRGRFSPEGALRQLLRGTGWTYCYVKPDAVAISPITKTDWHSDGCRVSSERYAREAGVTDLYASESSGERIIRLLAIPEVLVRGTRSLNADIERTQDDVQPYVVLNREAIERSGAKTIEDLLQHQLTMVNGLAGNPQQQGYRSPFSNIGLRGLPSNQTLILIDGRRAASYSISGAWQQPDINSISLAQVERIEVLPATASSLYGGSATGGVINIVRWRDYSGLETYLQYGGTFKGDGRDRKVGISGGFCPGNGSTTILLNFEHADSDPIFLSRREYLRDRALQAELASPSGSSIGPLLGYTTNIRSTDGSNLALKSGIPLNAPITHVPEGYAGASSDAGAALVRAAGSYNTKLANTAQSSGAGSVLSDAPTIDAAGLFIERRVGTDWRLFADGSFAKSTSRVPSNGISGTFEIPAGALHNPFQQSIQVATPAVGADQPKIVALQSLRTVIGGTYRVNDRLRLAIDHVLGRVRYGAVLSGDLSEAGRRALESGDIDVFRDTNIYGIDFASLRGAPSVFSPSTATLQDSTLRGIGSATLPLLNDINLNASLERRKEVFGEQVFEDADRKSVTPKRSQAVTSVFVEAVKDVVSVERGIPGIRSLEIELAGRFDDYRTRGADLVDGELVQADNHTQPFSPTFGIRFEPDRELTFRASYGKGFLPPAADQLVAATPVDIDGSRFALRDPLRGGELLGQVIVRSGGSATLRPEESKNLAVGVILNPYYQGIRLSVDWIRTTKQDEITNIPLSQSAIDHEALLPEGTITRAAPSPDDPYGVGAIQQYGAGQTNAGRSKREVVNVALNTGAMRLWDGELRFSAAATRQLKSQVQLNRSAPWTEYAGLIQAPMWKAVADIEWRLNSLKVVWTSRFASRYWLNVQHDLDPLQDVATVHHQVYSDVVVQWTSHEKIGLLSGLQLQLSMENVFGTTPPLDMASTVTGPSRYSALATARGSEWIVSIRKRY